MLRISGCEGLVLNRTSVLHPPEEHLEKGNGKNAWGGRLEEFCKMLSSGYDMVSVTGISA